MPFSYLKLFLVFKFTLQIVGTLIAFSFWPVNFASLVYNLCFNISETSRNTNIVYIGIYLVYLILAYKKR